MAPPEPQTDQQSGPSVGDLITQMQQFSKVNPDLGKLSEKAVQDLQAMNTELVQRSPDATKVDGLAKKFGDDMVNLSETIENNLQRALKAGDQVAAKTFQQAEDALRAMAGDKAITDLQADDKAFAQTHKSDTKMQGQISQDFHDGAIAAAQKTNPNLDLSQVQTPPAQDQQTQGQITGDAAKTLHALEQLANEGRDTGPYGRINTQERDQAYSAEMALLKKQLNNDPAQLAEAQKEFDAAKGNTPVTPKTDFEKALANINPDALRDFRAIQELKQENQSDPAVTDAINKNMQHLRHLVEESAIYDLKGGSFKDSGISKPADKNIEADLKTIGGDKAVQDAKAGASKYDEGRAMGTRESIRDLGDDVQKAVEQAIAAGVSGGHAQLTEPAVPGHVVPPVKTNSQERTA